MFFTFCLLFCLNYLQYFCVIILQLNLHVYSIVCIHCTVLKGICKKSKCQHIIGNKHVKDTVVQFCTHLPSWCCCFYRNCGICFVIHLSRIHHSANCFIKCYFTTRADKMHAKHNTCLNLKQNDSIMVWILEI